MFLQHVHLLGMDRGGVAFVTPACGHAAVIVFFVLSGFVIADSTARTHSLADYAIKRMSRVYSVAVPALLLAMAVQLVQRWGGEPATVGYELRKPLIYVPLHLAFAGDLWSWTIAAFNDVPYWSLNYEVWYYVAFGMAVYLRGWRRWAGLVLLAGILWPKVALLFPVWAGGALVHGVSARFRLGRPVARGVSAAAAAALAAYLALGLNDPVADIGKRAFASVDSTYLRYSQWFLSDYVVGVLAMAALWGLCGAEIAWPGWLARIGRNLASVSFGLYLAHLPLLLLFGLALPNDGPVAAVLAFAGAIGFGMIFEPQRTRLRRLLRASVTPALAKT